MRALRRSRYALAFVAASCMATGCFEATFVDARSPAEARQDVWLDGFLFGLVGSGEVDTRFFCESGPAKVGVYTNAGTWALTVLSLGIYTPKKAAVTCAAARRGR
jgi:hypothetical protein